MSPDHTAPLQELAAQLAGQPDQLVPVDVRTHVQVVRQTRHCSQRERRLRAHPCADGTSRREGERTPIDPGVATVVRNDRVQSTVPLGEIDAVLVAGTGVGARERSRRLEDVRSLARRLVAEHTAIGVAHQTHTAALHAVVHVDLLDRLDQVADVVDPGLVGAANAAVPAERTTLADRVDEDDVRPDRRQVVERRRGIALALLRSGGVRVDDERPRLRDAVDTRLLRRRCAGRNARVEHTSVVLRELLDLPAVCDCGRTCSYRNRHNRLDEDARYTHTEHSDQPTNHDNHHFFLNCCGLLGFNRRYTLNHL